MARRDGEGGLTLRQILRDGMGNWVWVCCEKHGCGHRAPLAIAPLAIRWGLDASSDLLRRWARCTACGGKGATLRVPSWQDSQTGVAPFPVAKG